MCQLAGRTCLPNVVGQLLNRANEAELLSGVFALAAVDNREDGEGVRRAVQRDVQRLDRHRHGGHGVRGQRVLGDRLLTSRNCARVVFLDRCFSRALFWTRSNMPRTTRRAAASRNAFAV